MPSVVANLRSLSPSPMRVKKASSRAASPNLQYENMQSTPTKNINMKKSSSSPDLGTPKTPLTSTPGSSKSKKKMFSSLKKRMSVSNKGHKKSNSSGGGTAGLEIEIGTDGSSSGNNDADPTQLLNAGMASNNKNDGTPPRYSMNKLKIDTSNKNNKETINGSSRSDRKTPTQTQLNSVKSADTIQTYGPASPSPRISNYNNNKQQAQKPFQFISDDNFTRRVESYDGQVITCTDSQLPTYEVGNYLGGGVAGVVYEGKRLRPVNEYPPIRIRGGGAFYPNSGGFAVAPTPTAIPTHGAPLAMSMTSSSLSSVRRTRSGGAAAGPHDTAETGTGLFADVYRAVNPHYNRQQQQGSSVGSSRSSLPAIGGSVPTTQGMNNRLNDDKGGCTTFLFGGCGNNENIVDDRSFPLGANSIQANMTMQTPPNSLEETGTATGKERYKAVDMSSIEVPAAFSSMDHDQGGVVVDDADAPNRSKREAKALSRNAPQAATTIDNSVQRSNSFIESPVKNIGSGGNMNNMNQQQTHLIEDMSETVAIKILNPVGFRLLDPDTLHKAVIVREGKLPTVNPVDGSFILKEEHVWWLVNPNSRNLRSLLRKSTGISRSSSRGGGGGGVDDASEESSLKRQQSLVGSGGGGVDRGSPERGLRLSLVATYVDPQTKTLRELPLPKCVEIWGHPPFAATDQEFEAMMEVLLRLNAGYGGSRKSSSGGGRGMNARSPSNISQLSYKGSSSDKNDPLASRRSGSTVYCPALSAYIAVPAIPPKYLRWLKQRRLATKEVRNMMRIGRHPNVVHLYEVLEMVQDSKSTMILILELVRGGELFDLISSNSSSKRKNERGNGSGGGGGANAANELHEVTMRKFFSELASGINFIHSCGVAHRDLKPENLLIHTKPATTDTKKGIDSIIEEEKTLKIADFGLSAAFQLYPVPSSSSLVHNISRGDSASRWDGNSVLPWDGSSSSRKQSSGLPLSPQSTSPASSTKSGGISPLLNRVGATALSMLTCGSMTNVCVDESGDVNDLVDDGFGGSGTVDLRRMTSVVGSPHYVAPEIIAQTDKGRKAEGGGGVEGGVESPQDRKARHAARVGYDGTKADVWSAGVILYAMLFRSLPFGEDLLRCPRYQAFQKWYNEARQILTPVPGKQNRRAVVESTLDPVYDEFDEEEMLGPHWFFPSEITAPGRDLIVAMLNPNPSDRLSIEAVLKHPWLRAMDDGFTFQDAPVASTSAFGCGG